MRFITDKKLDNIENYLILTLRETGMAFQMREMSFTFMLPCIVIDFFLNNQPDALIIQILFCYKTLHVSGICSAHHQEFSTVQSGWNCKFHHNSAWKRSSEICMKLTSAECTVENS